LEKPRANFLESKGGGGGKSERAIAFQRGKRKMSMEEIGKKGIEADPE